MKISTYKVVVLLLILPTLFAFNLNLSESKKIKDSYTYFQNDSTKVKYTLFKIKNKLNWYCNTETSLQIKNFGNNLSDKIRNKVITNYKENISINENQTIYTENITVENGSWLIIYEGNYKFDDCEYKRNNAIITNEIDLVDKEIREKINTSFIAEHYQNHKVVFKEKVELNQPSYLEKIHLFFKEILNTQNLDENEKKIINNSIPTGVRG